MPTEKKNYSKRSKLDGSGLLNKFRLEKQIALPNFIVIFNSLIVLNLVNDVSLPTKDIIYMTKKEMLSNCVI